MSKSQKDKKIMEEINQLVELRHIENSLIDDLKRIRDKIKPLVKDLKPYYDIDLSPINHKLFDKDLKLQKVK